MRRVYRFRLIRIRPSLKYLSTNSSYGSNTCPVRYGDHSWDKSLKCILLLVIYLVCPRAKLQNALLPIKRKILYIYRASAGKGSRAKPTTSPRARQNHRRLVLVRTATKLTISTASGIKNIRKNGCFLDGK